VLHIAGYGGIVMKKLQSIRAEASTFEDLKLLAAMNEIPIGTMLTWLVRDEIARMQRGKRSRDAWDKRKAESGS
jgi:hypothetical protein